MRVSRGAQGCFSESRGCPRDLRVVLEGLRGFKEVSVGLRSVSRRFRSRVSVTLMGFPEKNCEVAWGSRRFRGNSRGSQGRFIGSKVPRSLRGILGVSEIFSGSFRGVSECLRGVLGRLSVTDPKGS